MNITAIFLKRSESQLKCTAKLIGRQHFSSTTLNEKIEIPKRIPRSPTDILRALESTINRDPTAAHYKYHDDPYLIPMSNVGKRTFAMAQEAGKKAAHWIRQEHSDLFGHREADPVIQLFLPKVVFNEDSKVNEDDLKRAIADVQVADAQLVYKLLKNQNVEISQTTQQDLLDMLCYFNCDDTLPEEFIEERWFKQSSRSKDRQRKTWQDGSFAEELFISIENPTSEAYCAIIQGMARYYQVDRAWQLFEEAQQKNLILSTETYNSIIRVANFLKESYDMRWTLVANLLTDMNKASVKPNLGTLNSVLYSLNNMGSSQNTRDMTLKVLREFKELEIQPSLGSWYYVLTIFCKERGPISTVLHDIMVQVENKEHTICDSSDTNFFVTAMDVCRHHLRDVDLGKRVDKLLHVGNNYDLIGDSFKESIYYRHYFTLLATSTPLEEFMTQVYEVLVPNIYVPEPGVMNELLKQVDLNGATEYIPRLWSDMTIFDQTTRENLIESMLNIMVNNEPDKDSILVERFSYIAWDIYTRVENQHENKFNKLSLTGDLLGIIMMLLLRNNEFEMASTIMDKLNRGHSTIVGVPKYEAFSLFVDHCIEKKAPSKAVACIQYCSDSGFPEAEILAARLNQKLTLDESQLNGLSKIVGDINLGSRSANNE